MRITWCLVLLSVVAGGQCYSRVIRYLTQELNTTEWNEDLAPVLESLGKRVRKEFFFIAQDILYDDDIDGDCIQSFMRIANGLQNMDLWALRRKLNLYT